MALIQIIAIVFAAFAWSRALLRFKDRKISLGAFLLWTLIWAAVVVVALVPAIPALIASLIGIRRPVDIAVYLSIIILFYLVFRIYVKLDGMEQNMTKLVREMSLTHKKRK